MTDDSQTQQGAGTATLKPKNRDGPGDTLKGVQQTDHGGKLWWRPYARYCTVPSNIDEESAWAECTALTN